MTSAELVRERLSKKAQTFNLVFSTPQGEELLKFLNEEFVYGPMFSEDSHVTAFNLGAREVVNYINSMINAGDKL
jgi:hypothetical protein